MAKKKYNPELFCESHSFLFSSPVNPRGITVVTQCLKNFKTRAAIYNYPIYNIGYYANSDDMGFINVYPTRNSFIGQAVIHGEPLRVSIANRKQLKAEVTRILNERGIPVSSLDLEAVWMRFDGDYFNNCIGEYVRFFGVPGKGKSFARPYFLPIGGNMDVDIADHKGLLSVAKYLMTMGYRFENEDVSDDECERFFKVYNEQRY